MKKHHFFLLACMCFLAVTCNRDRAKRPNAALFLAKSYKEGKPEFKIKYLDSLQKAAHQMSNDSVLRHFLFGLSDEYYFQNKNGKSFDVSKKALHLSIAARDTASMAKAYSYIGDTYQISQKDSAYYYYQKSEKLYRLLKMGDHIGKMLFKKAYILFYEGNYIESEGQVSKALSYLKKGKDFEMLFTAYSLTGLNFEKLGEYRDALKYQLLAKDVLEDLKGVHSNLDKQYLYGIESSINISNIYEKTFQYDKSVRELESILTPQLKEKWPFGYVYVIGNLGYSKMKHGSLTGVEKYFKESLAISDKNNFENNIIYQLRNLGEYYAQVRDTAQSVTYLKKSLQLAEKIKMGEEIKSSLKFLSKMDHHNATKYDKEYIAITDSLAKSERISRNKYARIEYETSVVEDENKMLSLKNTYILIISLSLIFVLILLVVYRFVKSQKREILFRISQQKAEEEIFELLKEYQVKLAESKEAEQNRISKDLHDSVMNRLYGARMQLGILNDSNQKEAKEKRLVFIDLLQDIEQEIRVISHGLQSDAIDTQFDYVSLLSNLIRLQDEIGKTEFTFEADQSIDWNRVDSLVKITIFRIVQEAILNVTKHANAQICKVDIGIDEEKNGLVLAIKDNGTGFDVSSNFSGIGLKNIRDRVSSLKAQVTVNSSAAEGTMVQVIFFNFL